jgi:gentisate 1,2-dioxygenase
MKELVLNDGEIAKVSVEDWLWLAGYTWHVGSGGYPLTWVDGKDVPMHLMVAERMGFERPDHKNQIKLDNRRENLRPATRSQNGGNRPKNSNNSSGLKGVSWHKLKQKWHAQIAVHGEKVHLGYFSSKDAAYSAYCQAAKQYFEEFAPI